ncbi:MAG: class I SAM-dependent methyltransferase [Vicinamibacterales bacterium]
MAAPVHINTTATRDYTSDLPTFYEHYWHVSSEVRPESDAAREELVQALFGGWPTGLRALEIGPGGEGGLIRLLQPRGNEVFGLDVSASGVACCAQWGLDVRLCQVGAEPMPFDDDSFDVVFAFEVCEHFANPQQAIEEIRRVLRPGGRFIASTPNPLIHHWPRYFYPSLVERDGLREFFEVNQLAVVREIVSGRNRYERLVGPDQAGWSWIWDCRSLKGDAAGLREAARRFWDRTDGHGIRMRPMEAADLARAALAVAPGDVEALGLLAAASVYRVLAGEEVECQAAMTDLVSACAEEGSPHLTAARFWLFAADAEFRRFRFGLLAPEQRAALQGAVEAADPARGEALAALDREAVRLAALTT